MWALWLRPILDPIYEGKPLSEWLKAGAIGLSREGGRAPEYPKATKAVRAVGTNALPQLIRMMGAYDSPLKLSLLKLVEKQHLLTIRHIKADSLIGVAASGFWELRTQASNAVPALIQIYESNNCSENQKGAIEESLAFIGPPAESSIPALLRGTTNTTGLTRVWAFVALGYIHSKPEQVIPVLTNALQDTNYSIRASAIDALGKYGSIAKPAIPLLRTLLSDSNYTVREIAANVLTKLDTPSADADIR